MRRLDQSIAATVGSFLLLALSVPARLGAEPAWVTNQGARLVVGQPSFTRQAPLSSRETIGGVAGVAYGGDVLVIADGNRVGSQPVNNRVLVYRNVSSFVPGPGAELEQTSLCPACRRKGGCRVGPAGLRHLRAGRHDGNAKPHGRGYRRHSDRGRRH